jgi:hypothetical protein
MRHGIPFDTHAFVKRLTAAGMPEAQAEVQAEAIADLVDQELATKRDLQEMEIALKRDLKETETALKRDVLELELRLKHDLTIRLGAMIAAAIAIVAAIVKLLP